MESALPPPCSSCGGEILLRLAPRTPAVVLRCTSCGERKHDTLAPEPAAADALRETAHARERLRSVTETARPVLLLWLPPGGEERADYDDVAAIVRERLVADDPSVALLTSPYPEPPEELADVTPTLADLSLLAAPGNKACRAALTLVGDAIPSSRALVLGTGLQGDELAHPRLLRLEAGEDEPGGLFDAIAGTLATVRRVALWRALDPGAPEGDPLLLAASHADRVAAVTDDACAYLLRLVDRLGAHSRDRLLATAGGGDILSDRLAILRAVGAVEADDDGIRLTPRGSVLHRLVLPDAEEMREPESPLARLFTKARAGNQDALGRILQVGGEEAHRIAHRRIGPALRAKVETVDITQSVIAEMMKGIDRFEFRSEPAWRGYLRRLVENKIRAKADYFGAAKRDSGRSLSLDDGPAGGPRELEAGSPSPAEVLLRAEEYEKLEESLDQLPEVEREVLILRVFEGMSHREIAHRLGRPSEGAVHKLYGRALARLAALMGRQR